MNPCSRQVISAVVIGAATVLAVPIISPAHATAFTNTFYGTIVANDGVGPNQFNDVTTNDTSNLFGGGSLLGDSFALTYTYNNIAAGTTNFTSGTFYGGTNLVTATMTINGHSTTTGNSSDGSFGSTPTVYDLQAFTQSGQIQSEGVVINLAGLPSTDSLSTMFPAGTTGFQNCTFSIGPCLGGSIFDTGSGETLVLDVQSINGTVSVPAPPLSNLAALGVLGLAFLWRRRRQIFGLAQ